MSKSAVIFDVDGTLADCSHRRHFLDQTPKNWKGFLDESLVILDEPISPVIHLAQRLHYAGETILVCTGRNERHRKVTREWLLKHFITPRRIYMRRDDDFRSDEIAKEEMLYQIRAEGYEPWLVVDDRKRVVDMWRRNGLVCLQAADGDF